MSLSGDELGALYAKVQNRLEDSLLPAITLANRTGELPELLRLLGMTDLVSDDGSYDLRPTKVVVLGDSQVHDGRLRSIARKHGLDPANIEFALGYEELKHFNYRKLRDTTIYKAVLVGPMPHSTAGKGKASSAIVEMKSHPETFPPVIELRDTTGLKITNNSFARGIDEVMQIS